MCNNMDDFFKPIVLVTGFGPFANHPVNASWEAVKLMNKEEIERKHKIEFVPLEIPVTYENVDEFVPALWDTHEPKLMIHVGVSSNAKELTLEMQAHKKGYQRMDYLDRCPPNHVCPADGAIRMQTRLDIERICKEFNDGNPLEERSSAVVSKDAGRYLCEYIYYRSLSIDNTRTIFVHVPDMQIYSSETTARGLERILDLCLNQIREREAAEKMYGTAD
ncbi:pyroglutamyl-peptidase 1 [Amyelois transitella]|uniref:pyroglutamyl-peptidase 1 n=1 Tax=Amyelois transitella TaxID=680683 RepID=UPI00299019C9|nr:pyroglutamyl-peptidase 1 [Amyelois transitella]